MGNRVFTVGSLIPGIIIKQAAVVPIVKNNNQNKPDKIIIMQNENEFEISPIKGTLLDAALKQKKPIQYKCRKGTCGQCMVKIMQASGLSEPNEQEKKKLKQKISEGFRLACQAEIR